VLLTRVGAVDNAELKAMVDVHVEETKGQIETLKKVFKAIDVQPVGVKSDAAEGLIKEAEGLMPPVGPSNKMKVLRYGSLREPAKVFGNENAHVLLTEILNLQKPQRRQTDNKGDHRH
jgi:ferritin-like metal-binding protein YciE